MSPQKQADLRAFIDSCDHAVVSYLSDDGTPQSAVVAIAVSSELEIIFDTVDSSRKYRNLKTRPHCSVTVWKGEKTVQYEGVAEEARIAHREVYFQKLPDGRVRLKWPGIAYFVVRPKWIRYSDYDARPPLIEQYTF